MEKLKKTITNLCVNSFNKIDNNFNKLYQSFDRLSDKQLLARWFKMKTDCEVSKIKISVFLIATFISFVLGVFNRLIDSIGIFINVSDSYEAIPLYLFILSLLIFILVFVIVNMVGSYKKDYYEFSVIDYIKKNRNI